MSVLRSLAFKVARLNSLTPDSIETEIAGRKWFYGFKRLHPQLSLRQICDK
jgi:hypothetical protein